MATEQRLLPVLARQFDKMGVCDYEARDVIGSLTVIGHCDWQIRCEDRFDAEAWLNVTGQVTSIDVADMQTTNEATSDLYLQTSTADEALASVHLTSSFLVRPGADHAQPARARQGTCWLNQSSAERCKIDTSSCCRHEILAPKQIQDGDNVDHVHCSMSSVLWQTVETCSGTSAWDKEEPSLVVPVVHVTTVWL
jgi:hypothetical protein